MVKKVLFFDIDGTLLNSELKIPEGVKKELKRCWALFICCFRETFSVYF